MASSQATEVVFVGQGGEEIARVPVRLIPGSDVDVRN